MHPLKHCIYNVEFRDMIRFKIILLGFFLLPTMLFFSRANSQQHVNNFLSHLVEKNYAQAYALFEPNIASQLSEDNFIKTWEMALASLGNLKQYNYRCTETYQQSRIYYYDVIFDANRHHMKVISNDKNQILGFYLTPGVPCSSDNKYSLPKYSKPETYRTIDTVLKWNKLAIKSEIIIPRDNFSRIICILLAGSGPQDMDSSIGSNKPLKDLAVGLASKGIASIRFDKREANLKLDRNKVTIDQEYTNNILAIMNYLKNDKAFYGYKIFLVGHSLGGMIAPKIAKQNKDIKGVVLMGANFRPLEDLLLEQIKHLLSNDSNTSEAEKRNYLNDIERKINYLRDSLDLNSDIKKLPLDTPASYWLSIKKYNLDDSKNRKGIKKPMLVLWGEKDQQVKEKDFNLFKKYFQKRKNKFITYPKLNHIFIESENDTVFKGAYSDFKNIPEYVIKDIEIWLKKQ